MEKDYSNLWPARTYGITKSNSRKTKDEPSWANEVPINREKHFWQNQEKMNNFLQKIETKIRLDARDLLETSEVL